MLSLDKCKEILHKNKKKKFTYDEISKIREFLYQLATIEYEQRSANKTKAGNHLLKSID